MAALKRSKLLRIKLNNPERKLYCLALVLAGEQINGGVSNAEKILRNVAEHMEECNSDKFVAGCLSHAGFGFNDCVDFVGKLGHLERMCEAVFWYYEFALPEYQAHEGYPPIAAVHRKVQEVRDRVDIQVIKSDEVDPTPVPWMRGKLKSDWK